MEPYLLNFRNVAKCLQLLNVTQVGGLAAIDCTVAQ